MFFKLMIKRIRKDAVWKLFETHATDPKFERSGVLLCFIAQRMVGEYIFSRCGTSEEVPSSHQCLLHQNPISKNL